MRVFLDGVFFAEWFGDLSELASFSGVDVVRLSLDTVEQSKSEREAFKSGRELAVSKIKVTSSLGREFDGDEQSTTRMLKPIKVLEHEPEGTTSLWVLADNTPAQVALPEFLEVLKLAGLEQTRLWLPSDLLGSNADGNG